MAAIFAILGMDFLAAVQVIVYSGAILVLFLFVIMLLNIRRVEAFGSGRRWQAFLGTLVAAGIGAVILVIVPGWPGALEVGEEVLRGLEEDGYIQLQQPAERGGLLHVTEKGRSG